jgi:hypothetical protein
MKSKGAQNRRSERERAPAGKGTKDKKRQLARETERERATAGKRTQDRKSVRAREHRTGRASERESNSRAALNLPLREEVDYDETLRVNRALELRHCCDS